VADSNRLARQRDDCSAVVGVGEVYLPIVDNERSNFFCRARQDKRVSDHQRIEKGGSRLSRDEADNPEEWGCCLGLRCVSVSGCLPSIVTD
jgi:hypothetical protein